MIKKSLASLEFNIILDYLSENCTFLENKESVLNTIPSTDIEIVKEELLKTDTMMTYMLKYQNPRLDSSKGSKEAVIHSEKGANLTFSQLLQVARMYKNFDRIKKWYFQYERNNDVLDWQISSIIENTDLEKSISDIIISETQMADNASDELYRIRKSIKQTESQVRDKLDSLIKSSTYQKYLQEAVVTLRQNKFVIPVKSEFKNEVKGITHDVSSSGATYFIEPAVIVDLNGKIMQLYNQEQDEINVILSHLSSSVAANAPVFYENYDKLLEIDIIIAKAKLGLTMDARMPKVNDDLKFNLVKARHPLIDKNDVVPIDISLGYDYSTLVITGPNTGGKTVALKTSGLLLAMASSGILIPASENSSICVFDKILVDIGDEQSIQQSLSTFSGHMKNISKILELADDKSLVLMDELGSGTDPAEGAALAISIIEKLRELNSKVMTSTHYGEIKIFAIETNDVQNASCEFDIETLSPTYKIIVGVPGKSNAFNISRRLGISKDIINSAKTHLSNEDKKLNSVFSQLEDMKKELVIRQEEIDELKNYASRSMEKANKESEEILNRAKKEAEMLTFKAKEVAQRVQDEAYNLSDELKKLQKQENVSAQKRLQEARDIARNKTSKLLSNVQEDNQPLKEYPKLTSVKKGDKVIIASLNKEAVVQSVADNKGMVQVTAGIIKTKVHIDDLYLDTKQNKPKNNQGYRNVKQKTSDKEIRSASSEINLLGMNVEDAILEVDRFIDMSFRNHLKTIYLIHGKGTGVLRSGIHTYLKKHKSVAFFRIGNYGEGESGVTVVELK